MLCVGCIVCVGVIRAGSCCGIRVVGYVIGGSVVVVCCTDGVDDVGCCVDCGVGECGVFIIIGVVVYIGVVAIDHVVGWCACAVYVCLLVMPDMLLLSPLSLLVLLLVLLLLLCIALIHVLVVFVAIVVGVVVCVVDIVGVCSDGDGNIDVDVFCYLVGSWCCCGCVCIFFFFFFFFFFLVIGVVGGYVCIRVRCCAMCRRC